MDDCGAVSSNAGMTICKVPENEALGFDQPKLNAPLKSKQQPSCLDQMGLSHPGCSPPRFSKPKGSDLLIGIVFELLHRANQNLSTLAETSAGLGTSRKPLLYHFYV